MSRNRRCQEGEEEGRQGAEDKEEYSMLPRDARMLELQRSKSWRGRKSTLRILSHTRSQDDVDPEGAEMPRPPFRPREFCL